MQGMDTEIEQVVVAEHQPDGFLFVAIHFLFLKASELRDSVIDVCDKISGLQGLQFTERHRFCLGESLSGTVAMEPFKDLVVGVTSDLQYRVDETLAKGEIPWPDLEFGTEFLEDSLQSIQLPW